MGQQKPVSHPASIYGDALVTHKPPPQPKQNDQFDQQHNGQLGDKCFIEGFHDAIQRVVDVVIN
jgi:hypothetical protein